MKLTVLLFVTVFGLEAYANYPEVRFELSPSLDQRICGDTDYKKIYPWYAEAYARLPEFQADWDIWGPKLLGATVELIGEPFRQKEREVVLMVCPKWIALGTPLLMPYWPFLKSVKGEKVATKSVFFTYLFHELLHSYVYELIPYAKMTPLKQKYASGGELVLAHLHVMAIQKAVLESLSEFQALKDLQEADKFDPAYSKTWQIVESEGTQGFLQELKREIETANRKCQ